MGFVTLEEVEVNFAHPIFMPQEDVILYPFGTWDEQIVSYCEPIVVETSLIPGYVAISANTHLARRLQSIAKHYHCEELRQFDKLFLPNPNLRFCDQPISLVTSMNIYFIGIYCTPLTRTLLMKII